MVGVAGKSQACNTCRQRRVTVRSKINDLSKTEWVEMPSIFNANLYSCAILPNYMWTPLASKFANRSRG
jgi:hypothetical protein